MADDTFLDILTESRTTCETIDRRMSEASSTAENLEETRQLYKPHSQRGSLLYLALCEMWHLNPFYQWSLETFKTQLQATLTSCQDKGENRRESLKDSLTWEVYCDTCRGLFDDHRLVLAFLIAKAIDAHVGNVPQNLLEFFLRGATDENFECANAEQVGFL